MQPVLSCSNQPVTCNVFFFCQLAIHARQAKKAVIQEYAVHHDDPVPPTEVSIAPPVSPSSPGMEEIDLNDDGGKERSEVNENMVEGGKGEIKG